MSAPTSHTCRACGAAGLTLARPSTLRGHLAASDFAITDSGYGQTLALYTCPSCGLAQCPDTRDVLKYYTALEDPTYEDGAAERTLQAEKLVAGVLRTLGVTSGRGLRLLDVGAGSGILVAAARKAGFDAVGIEPSVWLSAKARDKGLPVVTGVLPHDTLRGNFDVVMLIDVIEHVDDPLLLLTQLRDQLKPSGSAYVVTPDSASFFARVMGYRWWHYRIAHISYFNRRTLARVVSRAGLQDAGITRPGWYFSYAYLRERLMQYLPAWLLPPAAGPLENLTIPLNLGDSILMRCKRP